MDFKSSSANQRAPTGNTFQGELSIEGLEKQAKDFFDLIRGKLNDSGFDNLPELSGFSPLVYQDRHSSVDIQTFSALEGYEELIKLEISASGNKYWLPKSLELELDLSMVTSTNTALANTCPAHNFFGRLFDSIEVRILNGSNEIIKS